MKLLLAILLFFAPFAASAQQQILLLGNSLAAGYGVDPDQAWPGLLQKRMDSLGYTVQLQNAGLSGETTSGGLRRVDWLLRRKVDIFILELGGNDGLRGIKPDLTEQNLRNIVAKVRAKNPEVVILLAGMQIPPNMGEQYTTAFRDLFPRLAKELHLKLIPFLLEGVGGVPELNLPDGIHPNPEGHKIVAETVWQYLKPLVKK